MKRICLTALSIGVLAPVWAEVPPVPATNAAVSAATATPAAATAAPALTAAPAAQTAPAGTRYIEQVLPTCEQVKAFKNKLHQVINTALHYPAELSFYPATGVTIVGYDYYDRKVSNVRITQASNDGRLDRAAINAVKNADYSSIPSTGPFKIHDSVIFIFDNSANSEKNVAEQQKQKDPALQDDCG